METEEVRDLVVAWLALGAAFSILIVGTLSPGPVLVALMTAGVGFLLHELAHKYVAQRCGLSAAFQANYTMLAVAVVSAFLGFLFAAPGAVYTQGQRTPREQVWISVAGPVTNLVLAAVFFFVPGTLGYFGFRINAWLALFNMIPFAGLDGEAVYRYAKGVYTIVTVCAAVFVFLP